MAEEKEIKIKGAKRIRQKELVPFTKQLAAMNGAGSVYCSISASSIEINRFIIMPPIPFKLSLPISSLQKTAA